MLKYNVVKARMSILWRGFVLSVRLIMVDARDTFSLYSSLALKFTNKIKSED